MTSIQGISYPLSIVNGGLSISTDLDLVDQQIRSVIETRILERVMQPQLGTLNETFQAVSNPSIVAAQLQNALELQIVGVLFQVTADYAESGTLTISIGWSVNGVPQPPIGYSLQNP